eukprot:784720-Pyramimonas_sp.AAC.1
MVGAYAFLAEPGGRPGWAWPGSLYTYIWCRPTDAKSAWRRTQPYAVVSATIVHIVFGGVP